jgi:hypothetical protein
VTVALARGSGSAPILSPRTRGARPEESGMSESTERFSDAVATMIAGLPSVIAVSAVTARVVR